MQNQSGQPATDFESAKSDLSDTMKEGKRTATAALHDARDEVVDKAGGYAAEAKEALKDQAEHTQRDMSATMQAFGGALRAASEHLENSNQSAASKMILDAAGGIDRLSSSLKDKPFNEILGDIRSFGRENATALVATSVLAGLALGRFIKSEAPGSTGSSSSGGEMGKSQMDRPSSYGGATGSSPGSGSGMAFDKSGSGSRTGSSTRSGQ
jgi:hypothetical protein